MKLTGKFGDEFKYAKITHSKILPVTRDGEFIGTTIIHPDGMAEMNIVNEEQISNIKNILGISGVVTSRQGNLITGIDLKGVSILSKESWKVNPINNNTLNQFEEFFRNEHPTMFYGGDKMNKTEILRLVETFFQTIKDKDDTNVNFL
jgi:hypothetical protein